jgi:hypothetical protein
MTWRNYIPADLRREFRQIERQAKADARKESRADRIERARIAQQSVMDRARDPRRRDEPFLRFVRLCPCIVCAVEDRQQASRTEAAHVRRAYPSELGWRAVGGAEKPHDARALPLCVEHHRQGEDAQHNRDSHDWYADHGIYPPQVCAELMRAHLTGADPVEAVETIAAEIRRQTAEGDRK